MMDKFLADHPQIVQDFQSRRIDLATLVPLMLANIEREEGPDPFNHLKYPDGQSALAATLTNADPGAAQQLKNARSSFAQIVPIIVPLLFKYVAPKQAEVQPATLTEIVNE